MTDANPLRRIKLPPGTRSLPDRLKALGYPSYRAYLSSEHWRDLQKRYFSSRLIKRNETGRAACYYCGAVDDLHLHHKTYKRLGAEYLMDVVLLCRMHHQTVHDLEKHGFQLWGATKLASRPPERIAKILSRPYYRKGDKKKEAEEGQAAGGTDKEGKEA